MFVAVLFIIAKTLKMTQMPLTAEWINKKEYITPYYGIIFINKIKPTVDTYNSNASQGHLCLVRNPISKGHNLYILNGKIIEIESRLVVILSLLQGIFPIQGWNPGIPHCR